VSLKYGSVCSGIEAASVAWGGLGWIPSWFSEIEKFPCAVLENHYPKIPNLGDMKGIYEKKEFKESKIDLLVGGTPCQSFSSAGERGGLDDARGNLAIEFVRIAQVKKPRWIVWENVPGVLSSWSGPAPPSDLAKGKKWEANEESDFGFILDSILELGYGFSYRILNAKNFGVPQKRRRVFVVGYLGDWRPPLGVLFEQEMLFGNPEASKGKRNKFGREVQKSAGNGLPKPIGVDVYNYNVTGDTAATLGANCSSKNSHGPKIMDSTGIRILTPIECERLQGFPDGYTDVPYKARGISNLRRKALGNSMAVPVMKWIGERIFKMDRISSKMTRS
jgi:DNA (cytosine-5)-methyltransferase 1